MVAKLDLLWEFVETNLLWRIWKSTTSCIWGGRHNSACKVSVSKIYYIRPLSIAKALSDHWRQNCLQFNLTKEATPADLLTVVWGTWTVFYYLAAAGSPVGEGWAEERHMVKLGMGRIEVGWTEPSWSCCYNRSMTQFMKSHWEYCLDNLSLCNNHQNFLERRPPVRWCWQLIFCVLPVCRANDIIFDLAETFRSESSLP